MSFIIKTIMNVATDPIHIGLYIQRTEFISIDVHFRKLRIEIRINGDDVLLHNIFSIAILVKG